MVSLWKSRLENATLSHLPSDFTAPAPSKNVESVVTFDHCLPSDILLSSFLLLVSKLTGDTDISVGTCTAAGEAYVFRIPSINLESTFAQFVDDVVNQKEEYEAGLTAFSEVQKELGPKPLFHIRFLVVDDTDITGPPASTDLDVDLTLYCSPRSFKISHNSLLFTRKRIEIFGSQLLHLSSLASSSDKISSLPLIEGKQREVLPDPTIDLHWSKFRGAISDIFVGNAKANPDKPCIIETTTDKSERIFTYDQINRKSNLVANHLVANDIKKGEVVVIYAFRGVDLVIGVMGILKAGATFSVIDPAYPVERQTIYLQVAQPSALLVLKKAGQLSDHVRNWIAKNLPPLKCAVQDLEVSDDGNTLDPIQEGGNEQESGIVIGPDDIPTLSFTSGSEGIPKGVRGRHFSLTYYFPWMASYFGLSKDDRFTMLSGIAHDPIQRDMFTPLFLGACLVVPTAEDIGTPGRLAEWCNEKRISVTHLTPAMGQLLSSQVAVGVQINSLRNAFFVGDVLTKRDVRRLQGIASGCSIINMYGTTETQRSVSFYRIPPVSQEPRYLESRKDIMPAGSGMQDVQLLVVSRDGSRRICGVGEIGEIFVRAGGLAEGYLSRPEINAEKFVNSWFVDQDHWSGVEYQGSGTWRGARDRLYRSGDLGRYLPDGNVECSGRADDQVKIRGFRIELGEIDTHLSRHPLVRENVTLLRRNKDEEPILVSYFVPDQKPELDDLLRNHQASSRVKNLTVLISGKGSNLQALIDATKSGVLKDKAKITLVVSSSKEAHGLKRAEQANIENRVWSKYMCRKQFGNTNVNESYNKELARLILEHGKPDLVVCAGYMLILTQDFLSPIGDAKIGIINIHPALPGDFTGTNAIERAYKAFQAGQVSKVGLMVHRVIREVDMGEPILTKIIDLQKSETLEHFESRLHAAEHIAIVEATATVVGSIGPDVLVERMQKYQPLVRNIREYLKTKLAIYAVPSVYVPMEKMPLNPNGKVDKPALPYPDTAQQAAVRVSHSTTNETMNSTQKLMHDIWVDTLPQAPASIPLDEDFFNLGGHSVLATKLIFNIRNRFVLDNVPLGTIYKSPTIAGLSEEIDRLRGADIGNFDGRVGDGGKVDLYSRDAQEIAQNQLATSYPTRHAPAIDEQLTVLLTGATGFVGAFVLRDLLQRKNIIKVITHVRAKTEEEGLERIMNTCEGYGVWEEHWKERVSVVIGDLAAENLGIESSQWHKLSEHVDLVIHNGALVHWIYPYSQLKGPNVIGTLSAMSLCAIGRPKIFCFVSSTSVLDTEYFVRESDRLVSLGGVGILEKDDLEGSSKGLGNGYGQSKWAAEHIVRAAGQRGLNGCIVRPGYIVGDTVTGVTNPDDFIVRLIKGCIQLKLSPDIENPVNMVPVDHVARVIVATTLNPPTGRMSVAQITGHPRIRFNTFLGMLPKFGFEVTTVDYIPWKIELERHVEASKENALYPLLHFVTEDLPGATKAPEMDDTNAREALKADQVYTGMDVSEGRGVTLHEMGIYLRFLTELGYLDTPEKKGKSALPDLQIRNSVRSKFDSVGGRGSK